MRAQTQPELLIPKYCEYTHKTARRPTRTCQVNLIVFWRKFDDMECFFPDHHKSQMLHLLVPGCEKSDRFVGCRLEMYLSVANIPLLFKL